jgi:hypothetical protein
VHSLTTFCPRQCWTNRHVTRANREIDAPVPLYQRPMAVQTAHDAFRWRRRRHHQHHCDRWPARAQLLLQLRVPTPTVVRLAMAVAVRFDIVAVVLVEVFLLQQLANSFTYHCYANLCQLSTTRLEQMHSKAVRCHQ